MGRPIGGAKHHHTMMVLFQPWWWYLIYLLLFLMLGLFVLFVFVMTRQSSDPRSFHQSSWKGLPSFVGGQVLHHILPARFKRLKIQ